MTECDSPILELAMLNFRAEYKRNPTSAMAAAELILEDEEVLRHRLMLLAALGGESAQALERRLAEDDPLCEVVERVGTAGVIAALTEKLVKPKEVNRLLRHPQALRAAAELWRMRSPMCAAPAEVAPDPIASKPAAPERMVEPARATTTAEAERHAVAEFHNLFTALMGDIFRHWFRNAPEATTGKEAAESSDTRAIEVRLIAEVWSKLALASAISDSLQTGRLRVFAESSSTTTLAVLALTKRWRETKAPQKLRFHTNNTLIPSMLLGFPGINPHLLYAGYHLQPKYAGTFRVSAKQLKAAVRKPKKYVRDRALASSSLKKYLTDAKRCDLLLMAASSFNFCIGAFVGSMDNAMLKTAYLAAGVRVYVLIDWTKLISNAQVMDEFRQPNCIWTTPTRVVDENDGLNFLENLLNAGVASRANLQLLQAAGMRNPCIALDLHKEFVQLDRNYYEINVPNSWKDNIQSILGRRQRGGEKKGELVVYVAGPADPVNAGRFETRLREAVKEANLYFERVDCKFRLSEPSPESVYVDPNRRCIVDDPTAVSVTVWKCEYKLLPPAPAVKEREQRAIDLDSGTAG